MIIFRPNVDDVTSNSDAGAGADAGTRYGAGVGLGLIYGVVKATAYKILTNRVRALKSTSEYS